MGEIHLVMPMGGAGSRFSSSGYTLPKPLIKIKNKPFFFWAVESVRKFVKCRDITFVVLQKHVDDFDIINEIKNYYAEAKIITIDDVLPGPVLTCLEGVKNISDELPIIFNDCDHMFGCQRLYDIINNNSYKDDASLITFASHEPQFSYVCYSSDGKTITGTVEKEVVSSHAICGAYVFRNVNVFKNAAEKYKNKCPYNELFMSGLYNIMCDEGKIIKDYLLDFHVEYGTPKEYEVAKTSRFFEMLNKGD